MVKQLLTKMLLVAVGLLVGGSAWAVDITKSSVGDNTSWDTGYLGDKSQSFAFNSNGTWTFNFTNSNNETGDYANFLLECSNGTRDEFVLRADNFEVVRWANANITSTYAGSDLDHDLKGAAIVMTVTRNGYHIAVDATITPTTEVAAFTYKYDFYQASGDLTLYLSVDHAHLDITSAEWAANAGTITETKIVNLPDFSAGTLFDQASRITVVKDEGYNNLKFTTAGNSTNGYSLSKYDFSSLIGNDAAAVKITFNYFIPNETSNYQRGFTLGQADLRTGFAKQSYTSNGAMFFFGLSRNSSHNYFSINKANTVDAEGTPKPAEEAGYLGAWATAEIMVDLVSRTVSYKIIGTETLKGYDIAYLDNSDVLAKCNQIDFYDCANNKTSYLTNLVITKYVDSEASAYSVKAVNSEDATLKTFAAGMYKSGVTNKNVVWDRYINVNDQWYGPSAGTNCKLAITAGGETKITYPTSDIDYYFDETQLSKTRSWATGADKGYMSRGRGESLYANSTAYTSTLDEGIYEIVIGAATRNGSPSINYGYRIGDTNTELGTTAAWSNGSFAATQTLKNIVIPNGASFCFIQGTGNSNVLLDYITLKKITTQNASVGAKDYSTYCNADYSLDFTDKSIKAYIIKSTDGSALTLTQVNKVVKNTPLLLYSATSSDSQDIPVIADSEATDDLTGNKLVAGDGTAHTWVENTAEHYVLYTGGATPGFYQALNSNVAVGKAYLDLTGLSATARSFELNLGDDVTGISEKVTVNSEKFATATYNLNGQRVAQPTKGLYIVNGKKVVIK